MANYQSIPARFNKPKSRINHRYIDSVLKQQQNTIDTNIGLMQQSVEKVLGTDFANPEDAEMLKNKVQDVLYNLSNTDQINFTDKKARFLLQDALSNAAKDPEVLKEVANTKRIRAFQEQIKKAQEDGTYNHSNYQDALYQSGLQDYMKSSDEGRIKKLGALNYVNYYNAEEELSKVMLDISKQYEEKEVLKEVAPGQYEKITTDGLTPEETRNMAWERLSGKAKQQLAIDGRVALNFNAASFDSVMNEDILKFTTDREAKLKELQADLNSSISETERNSIKKEITYTQNVYDRKINERKDALGGSLTDKALFLEKNRLMSNYISDDYRPDYLSGIFETEAYKQRVKNAVKFEQQKTTGNFDLDGDGKTDIIVGDSVSTVFKEKEKEDRWTIQERKIEEEQEKSNTLAGEIYNNILNEQEKNVVDKIKEDILKINSDISDYEINRLVTEQALPKILEQANMKGDNDQFKKIVEAMIELGRQYNKTENIITKYNEEYTELDKVWKETGVAKFYEGIQNSEGLRSIINENGETTDVKEKLKSMGVTSDKDLLNLTQGKYEQLKGFSKLNEEQKKQFIKEAGYLKANMIFSAAVNALPADTQHNLVRLGLGQPTNVEQYFNINQIKKIKEALNLKGDINEYVDVFEDNEVVSGPGGAFGVVKVERIRYKDTPLFDFIKSASSREGVHYNEDTFEDVGDGVEIFNPTSEEFLKFRKAQSDANKININPDRVIDVLPTNTNIYNELKYSKGEDFGSPGIPSDYKGSIHLVNNPNDSSKFDVYIQQKIEGEEDPKEGSLKNPTGMFKAYTIKKELINNESFFQIVDTKERKERFEVLGKSKQLSTKPVFYNENSSTHYAIYEHMSQNIKPEQLKKYVALQTVEGFTRFTDSKTNIGQRGVSATNESINLSNKLKKEFQDNYGSYRVKLNGSNGIYSLQLVNRDNENQIIYQKNLNRNYNDKDFETLFHGYPAALVADLMGDALFKTASNISTTAKNYAKELR